MQRHFDEELQALKLQLMKMSALAEAMISEAVKALMDRDPSRVQTVYEREKEVNHLQVVIDEMCLTLIALHQPAAGDLRFILGAAKTNSDLERLADLAVNIVDEAKELMEQPPLKPFGILPRMAILARTMVRDSLHAFVNREPGKAREVLLRDDELDQLKRDVTAELTDYMSRDPSAVSRGLALVLVARNLERVGDHATNIAENTIFVVEGRDVRHHGG